MPRSDLWTATLALRACLACIALVGIAAAAGAPQDRTSAARVPHVFAEARRSDASAGPVSSSARAGVSPGIRNPFAPWTVPVSARFDPAAFASRERNRASGAPSAQREAGPAPEIVLQGLVLGSSQRAILSGVPGARRVLVMEPGDEAGGLTLVSVEPNGVRVRWADSTWVVERGRERDR